MAGKQKSFLAKMANLPTMLAYILEWSKKAHVPDPLLAKIELAAEEAITNIIAHSYQFQEGIIEIHCEKMTNGITITLADEGPFCESLAAWYESPLTQEPLSDGLGTTFLYKIMDKVEYKRLASKNILYLTKYF